VLLPVPAGRVPMPSMLGKTRRGMGNGSFAANSEKTT
jgi:hypothetical protein